MKVLITGADGLLGSNLVRELLDHKHTVRVFIHPQSLSKTLDGLPVEKKSGDILGESGALGEAVSGCDAVFHCAAITDQWASPELTWRVNLEGTRKVLDACVSEKIKRLIFVGSASSFRFGTLDNPGDESGPFPDNYQGIAYMESKHRAMELVREYVNARGLDAVIVIPTFMLGPFDPGPSSGELIKQFIVRSLKFTSPGGRNFAHVRDVARAMAAALEKGKTGEHYILGGENLTYLDFFARVAKIAGMPAPKIVLPKAAILLGGAAGSLYEKVSGGRALINLQLAKLSLMGTYYNSAKAIEELGMPQTPVEQAIEESIGSLKEYGHI